MDLTLLGWVVVVAGALIVGLVAQAAMKQPDAPYRWVVTSIATLIGAVVASEWLFPTTGTVWEGIAFWPAIIGGLVVGLVVDVVMQRSIAGRTGHGSSTSHA